MCQSCIDQSRRQFLALTAAGVAAGALALGAIPAPARAAGIMPTSLDPDAALAKLKEGNASFVKSPDLCASALDKRRTELVEGQAPWATILSCADSRVPPELVFGGLSLGELFICRNAGNIADTDVLGTIEYGAAVLGSPLVVVLGHSNCGAIKAACDVAKTGAVLPGFIAPMIDSILPAAKAEMGKDGDFVANTIRESAKMTAEKIVRLSGIVRQFVEEKKVKVVYAVYDIESGKVDFIG
ncbi:MAG: carbonic anhydrase [Aestuariivirga sp.]|jgi:carbonic anhydrase|uniref:carbonic anhydrase n=1 Tax=Aestuariivirga sp. TaxID=2650926 RepID=UPI00301B45C5